MNKFTPNYFHEKVHFLLNQTYLQFCHVLRNIIKSKRIFFVISHSKINWIETATKQFSSSPKICTYLIYIYSMVVLLKKLLSLVTNSVWLLFFWLYKIPRKKLSKDSGIFNFEEKNQLFILKNGLVSPIDR